MVALVGPAVFYGSFYSYVSNIDVRMEYLVTGPRIKTVKHFETDLRYFLFLFAFYNFVGREALHPKHS